MGLLPFHLPSNLYLNYEKEINNALISTATFYASYNIYQHLMGALNMHSGRTLPLKLCFGLLGFIGSSFSSYHMTNLYQSRTANNIIWNKNNKNKQFHKDIIRNLYVGIFLFIIIENKSFLTAIPSSTLSIGSFALPVRGSIPVFGDIASDTQRVLIQKLGRRFGCHQCGSRQIFSKSTNFIAVS